MWNGRASTSKYLLITTRLPTLKRLRPTILLVVLAGQAVANAEFSESFAKCLSNPISSQAIKHFRITLSGNQCFINGQPGSGWIFYEGSFQSNTFYVRSLSNSVAGSGPLRPGSVAGQSYTMNWDVDVINGGSASFSERTPNKKNRIPDDRPLTIVSSVLAIHSAASKKR